MREASTGRSSTIILSESNGQHSVTGTSFLSVTLDYKSRSLLNVKARALLHFHRGHFLQLARPTKSGKRGSLHRRQSHRCPLLSLSPCRPVGKRSSSRSFSLPV